MIPSNSKSNSTTRLNNYEYKLGIRLRSSLHYSLLTTRLTTVIDYHSYYCLLLLVVLLTTSSRGRHLFE